MGISHWLVIFLTRNPLEIWLFDECYSRFCAEDYNPTNIQNNFAHLANNSIGKYSKNFVYYLLLEITLLRETCGNKKL